MTLHTATSATAQESGATDTPQPLPWWDRLRTSAELAAPAIAVYLTLRMISIATLGVLVSYGHHRDPERKVYWDGSTNVWRGYESLMDVLVSWDGRWYTLLAESGYPSSVTGVDENGLPLMHRLAFSPLYPYLARSLTWIPGVDGIAGCLLVSFVSSIATAWGLYSIGNLMRGHRLGVMLAATWAIAPVCMVQNGAFSESLFTALVVWALYSVLRRRWIIAGVMTAFAGLSRPTALAIILTVGFAACVAAAQRRDGWHPYLAMVLSPIGYIGYIAYVGYRIGKPDALFQMHRDNWASYFDYGQSTARDIADVVFEHKTYAEPVFLSSPIAYLSVIICIGTGVLIVLAAMHRTPWVLILFAVVLYLGTVGSHAHLPAIGRHLLPTFPALVAPALVLAQAPRRSAAVVLVVLAVLSGWYGGWLPFASGQII